MNILTDEKIEEFYNIVNDNIGKFVKTDDYKSMVELNPDKNKRILVIGDIHGDLPALKGTIEKAYKECKNEIDAIVFLGDYGDRGKYSLEVYNVILGSSAEDPERIIPLRGNHEFDMVFFLSYNPLPSNLRSYFEPLGDEKAAEYAETLEGRIRKEVWKKLPYSALVPGEAWLVHGGVPIIDEKLSKKMLESLPMDTREIKTPEHEEIIKQMLWNDFHPAREGEEVEGRGVYFGDSSVEEITEELGVNHIIRGHEPMSYGKYDVLGNKHVYTLQCCGNEYNLGKASYSAVIDTDEHEIKELVI